MGTRMLQCILLLLLSLACWNSTRASDQVVVGQTFVIHSTVLNEDRTYQVSVPDSYTWATDRRYPVLYVLDGESAFLHTAVSAGFLATHGEIPEMIVVGITSTVRIRDFTQTDWATAWVGGGGAGNFKRFLSSELIPAIDSAYRTNGFRVLSGHSAGGQFVLYCLADEPKLFQAYIALSPSLEWDNNLPQRSLENAFRSTPTLSAFLYVARSDDAGQALADYERLVETLQRTSPEGFRWHSQAYPNETHSGVTLLAQIDGLRHLYEGYRFHSDLIEKGFAYAENHFQKVSKTVGWPLPVPESVINDFGYAALTEGKIQEALAFFQRNVKANPNSANAYDSLADAYASAEMWQEAADAAERAAALGREFDLPNSASFTAHAKELNDRLQNKTKNAH